MHNIAQYSQWGLMPMYGFELNNVEMDSRYTPFNACYFVYRVSYNAYVFINTLNYQGIHSTCHIFGYPL